MMKSEEVNQLIRQLLEHPEFAEQVKDIMLNQHLVFRLEENPHSLNIAETARVNNALFNLSCGDITVEDWAFFGHSVTVLTGTHDVETYDDVRQVAVPQGGRDVVIKRGAWVCSNATISGPCTIGEHAVVAACSFVNRDVPPYAVVAGTPAKIIRYLKPANK